MLPWMAYILSCDAINAFFIVMRCIHCVYSTLKNSEIGTKRYNCPQQVLVSKVTNSLHVFHLSHTVSSHQQQQITKKCLTSITIECEIWKLLIRLLTGDLVQRLWYNLVKICSPIVQICEKIPTLATNKILMIFHRAIVW